MPDGAQTVLSAPLSRRSFMKWSGVAGGAAVATGVAVRYGLLELPADAAARADAAGPKVVWSSCNVNCGSRCPLRMTVTDGTITRIDPDNTGDDDLGSQQVRACVRGRSIRQRIYSPERLKYPMKRVGKRGEGQFERISWDEAYQTLADKLKDVIAKYGNEAIYFNYGTGSIGGTGSHEFHVLAESGEDDIAFSDSSDYAANIEKAEAIPREKARGAASEAVLLHQHDVEPLLGADDRGGNAGGAPTDDHDIHVGEHGETVIDGQHAVLLP